MASVGSTVDDELNALASQCRALWAAWAEVSVGLGSVPDPSSPAALDATAFAAAHPTAQPPLGWAAGQLGSRFVAAMGAHVLTVAALIDQRELRLSQFAVIRAELELAGRAAWLIGPTKEGSWPSSDARAARALMELLADARRHLRAAKAQKNATAKGAYSQAESRVKRDLDIVFPGWTLEGVPESPDLPRWELGGEQHVGLSAGVQLFATLAFGKASGLYDVFSTLAHPSWISLETVSEDVELAGVSHNVYVLPVELLQRLVQLTCLSFYKAAHLAADYFWLDKAPLDAWASDAPASWFSG